jgi:hypothetical protein
VWLVAPAAGAGRGGASVATLWLAAAFGAACVASIFRISIVPGAWPGASVGGRHCALWPPGTFQWAFWHSAEQYATCLQRPHRSIDCRAAVAPQPAHVSSPAALARAASRSAAVAIFGPGAPFPRHNDTLKISRGGDAMAAFQAGFPETQSANPLWRVAPRVGLSRAQRGLGHAWVRTAAALSPHVREEDWPRHTCVATSEHSTRRTCTRTTARDDTDTRGKCGARSGNIRYSRQGNSRILICWTRERFTPRTDGRKDCGFSTP